MISRRRWTLEDRRRTGETARGLSSDVLRETAERCRRRARDHAARAAAEPTNEYHAESARNYRERRRLAMLDLARRGLVVFRRLLPPVACLDCGAELPPDGRRLAAQFVGSPATRVVCAPCFDANVRRLELGRRRPACEGCGAVLRFPDEPGAPCGACQNAAASTDPATVRT